MQRITIQKNPCDYKGHTHHAIGPSHRHVKHHSHWSRLGLLFSDGLGDDDHHIRHLAKYRCHGAGDHPEGARSEVGEDMFHGMKVGWKKSEMRPSVYDRCSTANHHLTSDIRFPENVPLEVQAWRI